jgi:hypothetical protein
MFCERSSQRENALLTFHEFIVKSCPEARKPTAPARALAGQVGAEVLLRPQRLPTSSVAVRGHEGLNWNRAGGADRGGMVASNCGRGEGEVCEGALQGRCFFPARVITACHGRTCTATSQAGPICRVVISCSLCNYGPGTEDEDEWLDTSSDRLRPPQPDDQQMEEDDEDQDMGLGPAFLSGKGVTKKSTAKKTKALVSDDSRCVDILDEMATLLEPCRTYF